MDYNASQKNAVNNPLFRMKGKVEDVQNSQSAVVSEKPSFGSKASPEECLASTAFRMKKQEAQEQPNIEEKPVEKKVRGGISAIMSMADALTR